MPRNGWRGIATLGGSSKCECMWEYWSELARRPWRQNVVLIASLTTLSAVDIYLSPRLRRHASLTLLLVALQLAAIECLAWYLPT